MLLDLLIVGLLIALNGVLAMSELALVSSKRPRLEALRTRGQRGAHAALELFDQPGRFLSTVQIGITLVGVLAGAFSGIRLAEPFAAWLTGLGVAFDIAEPVAVALVVIAVTYLSLIVGELVPKRLALRNPEALALLVSPAMRALSVVARPLVWMLDASSSVVLRLFPPSATPSARVSDEEIHALVSEAASAGVVEPEEKVMIGAIMRLADRSVRALMTPRKYLDWIDLDDPVEIQRARLRTSRHSKLIAARGDIDHFVGLIAAKHIVDAVLDGAQTIDPGAHVEEALVLPDSLDALDAIAKLKRSALHAAIVVDEFGALQGLVTVTDILSAIAGEFHLDQPPPTIVEREDGTWLVDGELPAGELAERLGVPLPAERDYETAAGLVLSQLGHLPRLGEVAWLDGWGFEVIDLDGRRIDKLLLRREAPAHAGNSDSDDRRAD